MKFTKMEGAGNDYIYVDARSVELDWPEVSRRISDRHFGVGGDGLILIKDSEIADLKMSMFNADGSEGEMCGNGIRCFAKYAIEREIVPPPAHGLNVETLAGVRNIVPTYAGSTITGARVSMGAPILDPSEVPVSVGTSGTGPLLDYPFSMDGRDLPLSFRLHGQPPCRYFHRPACRRISVAYDRPKGGASRNIPPAGQLRDRERRWARQADLPGLGARLRRDHGLRHRRVRHCGGRPAGWHLRGHR